MACRVSQGELDKEDPVWSGIETLRKREDSLRAVWSRVHSGLGVVQILPVQAIDMNLGAEAAGVVVRAIHDDDRLIIIGILNVEWLAGFLGREVACSRIEVV